MLVLNLFLYLTKYNECQANKYNIYIIFSSI